MGRATSKSELPIWPRERAGGRPRGPFGHDGRGRDRPGRVWRGGWPRMADGRGSAHPLLLALPPSLGARPSSCTSPRRSRVRGAPRLGGMPSPPSQLTVVSPLPPFRCCRWAPLAMTRWERYLGSADLVDAQVVMPAPSPPSHPSQAPLPSKPAKTVRRCAIAVTATCHAACWVAWPLSSQW